MINSHEENHQANTLTNTLLSADILNLNAANQHQI